MRVAADDSRCVITVNSGSSSIKFALYPTNSPTIRLLSGKLERIGLPKPVLTIHNGPGKAAPRVIAAPNHLVAGEFLIRWLDEQVGFGRVDGIGHRVVHGGLKITQAQVVTPRLIHELRRISPYDPEHMPSGIQLMEVFHRRCPQLAQVACFDTAFHRDMPRVAKLLPIPRRFDTKGVQRFGFHGLSYTYLMEELKRVAGAKAARGRVILAHLGNGASLAAVRNAKSIDTSMGFTPAAGIPMSTPSGTWTRGCSGIWRARSTRRASNSTRWSTTNRACSAFPRSAPTCATCWHARPKTCAPRKLWRCSAIR
jgi:acetate kinase